MPHEAGSLRGLGSKPLLTVTSKKKKEKSQFGYPEILRLQGKAHLRGSACFSILLSSFFLLLQYIALCCISSLLLLSFLSSFLPSLYYNSDFVLFFLLLCFSPSLAVRFPVPRFLSLWGRFGSQRRFGARLRQDFALIKRMVGSTVGAAQELFFFFFLQLLCCGGKEFISFTAPLHHNQRQQFCGCTLYIQSAGDLFVILKLTFSKLHNFNERNDDRTGVEKLPEVAFGSRHFLRGNRRAATSKRCPSVS